MAASSGSKTAITIAIIGVIGTVLVAVIGKLDFKAPPQTQDSTTKPGVAPKTETDIKEKQQEGAEVIFDDTRSKTEGQSHDCLVESNVRKVTFIEVQGSGPSKEYVMADETGKKDEYIINENYLSKAAQIRLSQLRPGTHLTIKCVICKPGEGGTIQELYIVFMAA